MKTFKSIKPVYTGVSQVGEKNDCVIRAICNAYGYEYAEVHKTLEKNGRESKEGTKQDVLHKTMQELGFTSIVFGSSNYTRCLKTYLPEMYKQCEHVPEKKTIAKVIKELPNAKFVAIVKGHAIAVSKSNIIDYSSVGKAKEVYAIFFKEELVYS